MRFHFTSALINSAGGVFYPISLALCNMVSERSDFFSVTQMNSTFFILVNTFPLHFLALNPICDVKQVFHFSLPDLHINVP